jgi:hypothetical protein
MIPVTNNEILDAVKEIEQLSKNIKDIVAGSKQQPEIQSTSKFKIVPLSSIPFYQQLFQKAKRNF